MIILKQGRRAMRQKNIGDFEVLKNEDPPNAFDDAIMWGGSWVFIMYKKYSILLVKTLRC